MVSIIGVGDNTVDCYIHLGKMFPGGNAVNVPVLAQRYGASGSYLGWLADDTRGRLIHNSLKKEGVDLSNTRMVSGENACCEINLVDGDRVFGNYSEGVCDQIALTEDDYSFISQFDLTHTSLYSFIEPFLPDLKSASKKLSFDFTSDWDQDYLQNHAPFVDIAILSSKEDKLEENKPLMDWISSLGPEIVLITGGEQGALLSNGQNYLSQPIVQTDILVDTLGAGDAFAARFLFEHLKGTPLNMAMEFAAISAAETCKYHGAFGHGAPLHFRDL